jgi:hypothetical protein
MTNQYVAINYVQEPMKMCYDPVALREDRSFRKLIQ